jgi:hypothetical protein
MGSEELIIYQPIAQAKDRDLLMTTLVSSATPVRLVSGDVEGLSHIQKRELNGDLYLLFGGQTFPAEDRVTVRFEMRGRWYFFKSAPQWLQDGALVPVPSEMFEEQLRKNFRHVIPAIYPTRYEVTSRESGRIPVFGSVLDLNSDGLGFKSEAGDKFRPNEKIEGVLTLGKHRSISIGGIVRFMREQDGVMQVGLEFDHRMHHTEDRLNELILHLRHDVFYLDPKNSKIPSISNT